MADTPLDVKEISRRLPHRHPLLLVDRVLEVKAGERLVALKNVTVNEDFFRGHFPGNPIMPGVLIVEAMAQAAGLLISITTDGAGAAAASYLVGVDEVKFRRPVVPGDQLQIEVRPLAHRGDYWRFEARASVDGDRAAEAKVMLVTLAGEVRR